MTARAVGLLAVAVGDEDPAEAARLSAEKVAIVRRMDDRRQNGLSLNNLAWHLMLAGRYDEAGAALDEALPWLDPERDTGVLAAARHTGGTTARPHSTVRGSSTPGWAGGTSRTTWPASRW